MGAQNEGAILVRKSRSEIPIFCYNIEFFTHLWNEKHNLLFFIHVFQENNRTIFQTPKNKSSTKLSLLKLISTNWREKNTRSEIRNQSDKKNNRSAKHLILWMTSFSVGFEKTSILFHKTETKKGLYFSFYAAEKKDLRTFLSRKSDPQTNSLTVLRPNVQWTNPKGKEKDWIWLAAWKEGILTSRAVRLHPGSW